MFNNFVLIGHPRNIPDTNSLGQVNYEFYISKTLVSIEEYCAFLNNIAFLSDPNKLYRGSMQKIIRRNITNHTASYEPNEKINKTSPMTYINIFDSKRLCNWLHNGKKLGPQNQDTTEYGVYDLSNNISLKNSKSQFWIPSIDEWHKAAYFDFDKNGLFQSGYWLYPNRSDTIVSKPTNTNYFNINNFGNYVYQIVDSDNDTQIRGGCQTRSIENAHSSCSRQIHKYYTSNYIGLRLCKAVSTKNYSISLYDTYGDGWGSNHIDILDENFDPIINNIALYHGYGPRVVNIQIPSHNKAFYIKYYNKDRLSYENYYELYDDFDGKGSTIYRSPMYETPPETIMVKL